MRFTSSIVPEYDDVIIKGCKALFTYKEYNRRKPFYVFDFHKVKKNDSLNKGHSLRVMFQKQVRVQEMA